MMSKLQKILLSISCLPLFACETTMPARPLGANVNAPLVISLPVLGLAL